MSKVKNVLGWMFAVVVGVGLLPACAIGSVMILPLCSGCGLSEKAMKETGQKSVDQLMALPSSGPHLQAALLVLEGPVFDEEIGMWKTVAGNSLEATASHRLVFSSQKPNMADGKIIVIGKVVTNGQYSPPMEDYIFFAK